MKQRVAIARALVLNPKILLMDEPFAALDVQTRRMLYDQLVKIHEKTNKTILFVTHNINEAVALGDRAIIISPKIAGIKKEFKIDLPRPRQLDHPLINSITNAIIEESKEMYTIVTFEMYTIFAIGLLFDRVLFSKLEERVRERWGLDQSIER